MPHLAEDGAAHVKLVHVQPLLELHGTTVLCMGGVFIIVSHINPDPDAVPGADEDDQEASTKPMAAGATCGLDWLSSAILPAFDWMQARWTVDVHSMYRPVAGS